MVNRRTIFYSIMMAAMVIIIIILNRKKPANNNNEIDLATQNRLNKIDNALEPIPAEIQSINNQLKRMSTEVRKLSETEYCAILRNLDGTIHSEQPPGCSKLPWLKK